MLQKSDDLLTKASIILAALFLGAVLLPIGVAIGVQIARLILGG